MIAEQPLYLVIAYSDFPHLHTFSIHIFLSDVPKDMSNEPVAKSPCFQATLKA
jgi:hypothetical protein